MQYDITCSIVLFHNPVEELRKAIHSFLSYHGKIKLFLIDNSFNDDLRFEYNDPRIEYIFCGDNLGYGSAHNIAIKKVQDISKYHLVLNPDVEFNANIIEKLYQFMQLREDIGLVMPKVLYKNGEMQYLCKQLPSPNDLILRRFIPKHLKRLFKTKLESYELKHKDYNTVMEIPNLSGCFMFIRTKVLKDIGGFDEQYFMYLEDTDLCRRINEKYRTIYYPTVSIIHGYSKASYKSIRLMKYHLNSTIKYFNKWGWYNDEKRNNINKKLLASDFSRELMHEPFAKNGLKGGYKILSQKIGKEKVYEEQYY